MQYGAHPEPFYIDPFHTGKSLSAQDMRRPAWHRIYGRKLPWQESYLDVVDDLHILARVLNNLKVIYVRKGAHELALGAVERLILLQPDGPLRNSATAACCAPSSDTCTAPWKT